MRLEWLEDILAVVETGSFIKAAERRCLTQSAFSRRIRMIETHVGAELFDRARKPVEELGAHVSLDHPDPARESRLRQAPALRRLDERSGLDHRQDILEPFKPHSTLQHASCAF